MSQADAQEAAIFFHVEALGEIEGVVVSVPGEEAALAQCGGEFERSVAVDANRESGAALLEALPGQ